MIQILIIEILFEKSNYFAYCKIKHYKNLEKFKKKIVINSKNYIKVLNKNDNYMCS